MKYIKLYPVICLLLSSFVLSGCSAVMAGKRSTYKGDPKILTIGQTRMVVESTLGVPDMSSPLDGGKQRVIYRMDPDAHTRGARNAAVAGHIVADVLTLGLWEIAGTPAELAAQDEIHNYIVTYDASGVIESVEVLK